MPLPKPDPTSGLILLPAILPKGKELEDKAKGVADFHLDSKQLDSTKKDLGLSPFIGGQPRRILEDVYLGLKIRDAPDKEKKINIIYEENKGLIREPATVLKEGKADCDEVTRTAYLLAWESGVRNITMVEMKWTDPKTNERTGHSFIVLMPQSKEELPRIYDFTYFKKGKPLAIENNDIVAAITGEYAADAANPNFAVTLRKDLNEVEAAHYDQVGEYYGEKHPKMMEEAYANAVFLVPTEIKYNRNLAVAYEKQHRWKDALKYYEQCLTFEAGQNNPRILGAAGTAYLKNDRYDEARGLLERALELNPDKMLKQQIEDNLRTIKTK